MRLPPPEVVATWPPPNYTHPETQGPGLIIVELILMTIAWIFVGLRLYVRVGLMRKMDADDWLMVGAAVCPLYPYPRQDLMANPPRIQIFGTGVAMSVVLAFLRYGWGIHVWDVPMDKLISGRQVSFAAQAFFLPATTLAKVSILASYLRLAPLDSWFRLSSRTSFIFPPVHHRVELTRGEEIAIAFVILLNLAYFIVLFTQCM
jgi:hypothetical protein